MFCGWFNPFPSSEVCVMLGVIEQWYGDWFTKLYEDVGAEPVVASEMQTYRLNHRLRQSSLMRNAGSIEGESEGAGPESMHLGVLVGLALGHHNRRVT